MTNPISVKEDSPTDWGRAALVSMAVVSLLVLLLGPVADAKESARRESGSFVAGKPLRADMTPGQLGDEDFEMFANARVRQSTWTIVLAISVAGLAVRQGPSSRRNESGGA